MQLYTLELQHWCEAKIFTKGTLPVLPTVDLLFYDHVEFKIILNYKIGLGLSLKDQSIHMFTRNEVLPNFEPFKDNWISNKVLVKLR